MISFPSRAFHRTRGITLLEILITLSIASIVISMVMGFFTFSLRSFNAIGNYTQMDADSQQAIDLMLREIRESNLIVDSQANGSGTSLKVANTLASPAITNTFSWDPASGLLTWDRLGRSRRTLLSGCENWSFAFFARGVGSTNGVFFPTTNQASCKLINMSWKCSRANIQKKANTESIVTAEVVLRNKR